ncbi:MAG: DUF2141 domain-containing protein [Bacteroidetes bacterium]|nr:MAG: DUF2141 domain-containing protein [Bacteroidota bacterium]
MRFHWILIFCMPVTLFGQFRLEVAARGVETSQGFIQVALYQKEDDFLNFERVFRSVSAPAEEGVTMVVLEDLPAGEYAIAIFHDENGNQELDTNWLGMPRELLGFSRARMKTFGPPGFRECSLILVEDMTVEIYLE